MKKMFYSEALDKYFECEKECRKAELQYMLDKQEKEKKAKEAEQLAKKAEEEKKEAVALASKEKKELADAIESAKTKITDAENALDLARESYYKKVAEAKEAYDKAVNDARESILLPAVNKVKDAKKERYEAVQKFNDKFGTYTVKYTGEQAYNEMMKTVKEFNKIFNDLWF